MSEDSPGRARRPEHHTKEIAVDNYIKDLHADIAVAQWKAAHAVLEAASGNPFEAEQIIERNIGRGHSAAEAELLTALMWSTYSEAEGHSMEPYIDSIGREHEDTEDFGPVVNPDGTPTEVTLAVFGVVHTIGGKPINDVTNPGAYGRTHDMDCPACVSIPFTASPRSETYWSS